MRKIIILTLFAVFLTSCGGGGGSSKKKEEVVLQNIAPTVNAGANTTVNEGSTVSLNGSAVDSDGTISNYSWSQVSGPTVFINNTSTASTSFVAIEVDGDEQLEFSLSATDDNGATAHANVIITIMNIPDPKMTAGIYNGFYDPDEPDTYLLAIVTPSGRIYAYEIYYSSEFDTWGDYYIFTILDIVTTQGYTWEGFLRIYDLAQEQGALLGGINIDGKFTNDTFTMNLRDDSNVVEDTVEFETAPMTTKYGASYEKITGTYAWDTGTAWWGVGSISIDVDGIITGSRNDGCIYEGQVTFDDANVNVYDIMFTISACYEFSGNYTGAGYISPQELNDYDIDKLIFLFERNDKQYSNWFWSLDKIQ